jgi:hypothetical protein
MARCLLILMVALYATPAMAGGVVATPTLRAPSGGVIRCFISNASDKRPIEVEFAIYDFNGDPVFGPNVSTVDPLKSVTSNPVSTTGKCVARVRKGGGKSLRVSLCAEDSGSDVVAAVTGY